MPLDPAAITPNYSPGSPSAPGAASGNFVPGSPTAPLAVTGSYSAGSPSAPASTTGDDFPFLASAPGAVSAGFRRIRVTGEIDPDITTLDLFETGQFQGKPFYTSDKATVPLLVEGVVEYLRPGGLFVIIFRDPAGHPWVWEVWDGETLLGRWVSDTDSATPETAVWMAEAGAFGDPVLIFPDAVAAPAAASGNYTPATPSAPPVITT